MGSLVGGFSWLSFGLPLALAPAPAELEANRKSLLRLAPALNLTEDKDERRPSQHRRTRCAVKSATIIAIATVIASGLKADIQYLEDNTPLPLPSTTMAPAVVSNIASRFHRMSQSSGDKENYAAREEEKQKLAEWEAEKRPLEPSEIVVDPQKKPVGHSSKLLRKEDFDLIKTLGTGTFARVWLVRLADKSNHKNGSNSEYTKKVFALKILRKVDVIRLKQVEHVRNERNVLAAVAGHPFITTMVASFQDPETLYMLLDYCPGGEVFSYLRRARRFNEPTSTFYAAEIVLILEFLHEKEGVAYRDLKPENILIDAEGHLKLVDFGFAKKIHSSTFDEML